MADIDSIKDKIAEIAQRPGNVTFSEIEWVVKQLGQFYQVSSRTFPHGVIFRVDTQRFSVCVHNPGSRQLKKCYVRKFLNAMIELELYE